ncbi:hypothetical protein ACROYT_G013504 [Oculina patagonica]
MRAFSVALKISDELEKLVNSFKSLTFEDHKISVTETMTRFMRTVCIFIVAFLYISTENCNGQWRLNLADKLTKSGTKLSPLEQQLTDAQAKGIKESDIFLDENGDGHTALAKLRRGMKKHGKMLLADDIDDVIATVEKQGIEKSFIFTDKDGDGHITLDELKALMKKLGKTMTAAQVKAMITEWDTSGNGKVEYVEFQDYVASRIRDPVTDSTKTRFKKLDHNGDGFITSEEMALATNGHRSVEQIQGLIKPFDVNNDGQLSLLEYKKFLERQK